MRQDPNIDRVLELERERAEEQDFRLQNDREWKAKVDHQRARAEAYRVKLGEVAAKAHEYAAHYPEASDGRNTFVIFAEWIEGLCEGEICPSEPRIKALKWHGPDVHDEYYARSIIGNFNIGCARHDGYHWCMGEWHPTLDAAKAAAQADYEARIRSVLVSEESIQTSSNPTTRMEINGVSLEVALGFLTMFGGDETDMTLAFIEDGHSGTGFYCWCTEYPEDGAEFLGRASEFSPLSQL